MARTAIHPMKTFLFSSHLGSAVGNRDASRSWMNLAPASSGCRSSWQLWGRQGRGTGEPAPGAQELVPPLRAKPAIIGGAQRRPFSSPWVSSGSAPLDPRNRGNRELWDAILKKRGTRQQRRARSKERARPVCWRGGWPAAREASPDSVAGVVQDLSVRTNP